MNKIKKYIKNIPGIKILKLKHTTSLILIIFIIIGTIFSSGAFGKRTVKDLEDTKEEINVRIAMLSEIPLGWDIFAADAYIPILDDYQWTVGNKTYKFVLTKIYDKDIIEGKLTTENFDMLLVPGGGVGDEESIVKGTLPNIRPKVIKWKRNIANFIKDGGGYAGYCGGTALMCELEKKPETALEKNYHKSAIGVSSVKIYYKDVANYYICLLKKDGWKRIGPAMYLLGEGYPTYNGLCFDVPIDNNHPITDDFIGETCRVRWIGGPGLIPPEDPSNNIAILGRYPDEKVCENESMKIHYWKYTGGMLGLVKGLFKAVKWCKTNNCSISNALLSILEFSYDWNPTDEYVDLNQSDKPCMTVEEYPNKNKGRIVLNAFHPERNVWWGGFHQESPDTEKNCLAERFFKLTDFTPFNETQENETTHTWWMVRREIAYAAKVPDNDLPPLYGPSQVSDIYPYNQSLEFTITGNAEVSDGAESLDLFYRYSSDDGTTNPWSDWKLYDADFDSSNGWSWEFNSPNGTGYYQFYSIRHVKINEYEWLNETAPPGPDASVYVDKLKLRN